MDPEEKGFLMEKDLRKMLKGKSGISVDDIEEMIAEYKVLIFCCRTRGSAPTHSQVFKEFLKCS